VVVVGTFAFRAAVFAHASMAVGAPYRVTLFDHFAAMAWVWNPGQHSLPTILRVVVFFVVDATPHRVELIAWPDVPVRRLFDELCITFKSSIVISSVTLRYSASPRQWRGNSNSQLAIGIANKRLHSAIRMRGRHFAFLYLLAYCNTCTKSWDTIGAGNRVPPYFGYHRYFKRGSVPPRCSLGSAVFREFFLRNGSN
jgi:hypothetical protein